ncbi:WD40-repeat-containing domain protein [Ephemerocybe angulata]|uniref:WD40-repeat-containing domain protein n=1 Tax=Ephemerocybe angulata TaxID=980116 RepID=A0A8H6M314_9AGAR|nr:WD40-repeat-containing domain protein [Tulosesus angulatus]
MRNPKFVVDYTQPSIIRPQPPAAAAPADTGATGGEATTDAAATVPAAPATVAPPPPVPGFIPPPPAPERHPRDLPPTVRAHTLACSGSGILFFTRANRLHFKNLTANEEVGQICKIQEIHGVFTAIACGGSGETGGYVVAVGTSKGVVAIYDVQTKKRVLSWTLKPGVASLAWNGKILTIGAASGTIVHYDTRISPVEKMKEQAVTVTRHQAPITRMEWNAEGDMLASADKKGNVYCWKTGEKVPLDVGEFVLRRKKIKHCAAISAVSWCPWQPKNLVTADIKGVVQFWTIDPKNKDTNAMTPARLDTGSSITGLHWSSQCKEFMTTHGYKVPEHLAPPPPPPPPSSSGPLFPYPPPPGPNVENTLAVWQFPSLRFVTNMRMNTTDVPIGNSVVFAKGMKVVFGVPEQGKIHACDVWGKKKPDVKIRRQSSLDYVGCIR